MTALDIVKQWDAALRRGDWGAARALLDDSATYHTPEAEEEWNIDCHGGDEIVALMAAWKGKASDILVMEWAEHGNRVMARLRQPDWGDDSDWYQVIGVEDERITSFTDFMSEGNARAELGS